jgi:hypothetical protein
LFPRTYSAGGLAGLWDGDCPATHGNAVVLIEEGIAGVLWQEAHRWHQMLYSEVLREEQTHENRLNL